MSNPIFPNLREFIETAEHPIVLLLVSGECNHTKSSFELDLGKLLAERPEGIIFYTSCVPDEVMGFPRLMAPAVYYFLPKNQTPVFYRGQDAIARLAEDIPVLFKMAQGMSEHDARFTSEDKETIKKVDDMLASEDVNQFPPVFQQFRNLAKEAWRSGKRAAAGLPVLVSAEEAYARYQTCLSCDQFETESTRCKSCGCYMRMKTQLVSAGCPLSKWPKHK